MTIFFKKEKTTLKPFMIKIAIIAMSSTFLFSIGYAKSPQHWTGFYAGPEIGGVFNDADLNSNNIGFDNMSGTCNGSSKFSSFYPGLQVGYAHEFDSRVVLGVEGNFTYNFNKTSPLNCTCPFNPLVSDRFSIKNRLQTSIRGRIGYAIGNRLLPFLMGGGSFADLGLNYSNEAGDYYSNNTTKAGWLAGAGFEWLLSNDWSVSVEYFYTAYGKLNMRIPSIYGLSDPNSNAHVNLHTNNIAVVFNYWL